MLEPDRVFAVRLLGAEVPTAKSILEFAAEHFLQ
jgi:hypothetical protein